MGGTVAGGSSLNVDLDGLQDNEDDIKEKMDDEDLNAEIAILQSMPHEHKVGLYGATVKSKQTLNFGYGAFFRMRQNQYVRDCCSCCNKKAAAKAKAKFNIANKNLRRNAIGRSKKAQEFDIVNIVEQLRVSNFLASVYLKPYQQQLIRHFKNYSLDQTRLFNNDWKQLSRNELIAKIGNAPQDDSWEAKVNERIMQNTIALDNHTIKSKKFASQSTIVQIDYLDANDNESSDDIKTDSDYDENEVEEVVKPKIGWGKAS